MRITLDNIKIRNFRIWENAHQQQFMNDPNMPFETKVDKDIEIEIGEGGAASAAESLTLNKRVEVIGHYVHCFKDLRQSDNITTDVILSSLDP